MRHYGLITKESRKARAAKNLYEYLHGKNRSRELPDPKLGEFKASGGFGVAEADRFRVVDLRLHDEHLSPYFKTDMNLFHLLMIDNAAEMAMFRSEDGILFVFDGLPDGPQPFGAQGHDPR